MIVGKAKDKGMKRESMLAAFVFAGLSMFAGAQDNDPVLMTINGKNITKSEFEYIYHKNNRQQVDTNSIDEYLPLFINYKLKVDAAEKACIDTTAAFRTELNGYRDELAKPYLIDREMEEKLLQEAYDRLKVNVEMSHILFSTMNLPDAAAREEVRRKATEVLQQAREGADFAALAEQYSDDPSAKGRGGYLGYIKGGRLIYPFEKVAFSMKPGEVSDLVETRFGYHIIKVHNVRPDMGERLSSRTDYMSDPKQGGVLLDTGIYCACWLEDYLAGQFEVTRSRARFDTDVDSFVDAELSFAGQGDTDSHVTRAAAPNEQATARLITACDSDELPRQARLIGTKGTIIVDDLHRPVHAEVRIEGEDPYTIDLPYEVDDFYGQIHHFCELMRTGAPESPVMPLAASIRCAEMLDAIRASLIS